MKLDYVPLWSQLTDFNTADGNAPENRYLDCGPECTAIVLKHVAGVEISADQIKDVVLGQGATGYTYTYQLAGWLDRWAEVPTYTWGGLDAGQVRWVVENAVNDGRLCIVLLRFNPNNPASGHWVVAYGYADDGSGMICADPYGGYERVVSWDEPWWFKGDVIEVKRRRCMDVAA